MRFGLTLPIFDELADPRVLAGLAADAEAAGWEAVFVWDHVRYRAPAVAATDPWIAIAAMAGSTERVLLGPMVTPLARRRPQIVARQLVALDVLSAGRLVLGVGVGLDGSGEEFARFGEETDVRRRAERLDESLEVITGLLSGQEVNHVGPHVTADGVRFLPTPVQDRLPIWVAARWPNQRPLRRAARFDGLFVIDITPDDLPAAIAAVEAARPAGRSPIDIVVDASAGEDPRPWASAGATWHLTTFDPFALRLSEVRAVASNAPSQL